MPEQLASALSPALRELGYTVTPGLRLVDSTTLASADLVAFGSRVPSLHTSCLAANWCPSPSDAQRYPLSLSQTVAPIIYLAYSSDDGSQVWEIEFDRRAEA